MLDIPPEKIVKSPGSSRADAAGGPDCQGRLVDDEEVKERYARQPALRRVAGRPIWSTSRTCPSPTGGWSGHPQERRDRLYKAFGYTYEEVKDSILPMARDGAEPTSAMGVDTPLAVLSEKHQPLFTTSSSSSPR